MGARRIVTGVDENGGSILASDGPAEQLVIDAGRVLRIDDVWGADDRLTVPTDGSKPLYERFFPPPGGFRVMIVHLEPEDVAPLDHDAYIAERERVLVGYSMDTIIHEDRPSHHATRTVDVAVVLEGEVTLGLDDGTEVTVSRGDYVVQNGTAHSWRNRSGAPCSLAVFLTGADRG